MAGLSERTLVLSAGKTAKGLGYLAFSAGAARLYAPDDYAAFQAWWMVFMLVVPIAEGGFTAGLYHALPRLGAGERRGLVWRTFLILAALGALAALVIAAAAPLLAGSLHLPQAVGQLRAVALFIGAALPAFAWQAWMLVEEKTVLIAWMDVAGALVTGAALLMPVALGQSPEWGLWFLSAYALARTLVVAGWFHRILSPRSEPPPILPQLRYASQVSASRAMGVATKQIDRFFVGMLGTPAAFATYATGALEIPVIGVLTGSAATVLAPEISRRLHGGDQAGALSLWHESIRKISLALFPIGAAAAVLAHPLFASLYGARWIDAAPMFQIFALALPLRAAQYGSVLLAAGESARVFWGSLAGFALNVALCLWWVPLWSGTGAALATVVSIYAIVAVYLPTLAKIFNCPVRRLFPWGALLQISAACVPGALAAFLLAEHPANPWFQLISGSALFGALTVLTGMATGAVRKNDVRRMTRFFGVARG